MEIIINIVSNRPMLFIGVLIFFIIISIFMKRRDRYIFFASISYTGYFTIITIFATLLIMGEIEFLTNINDKICNMIIVNSYFFFSLIGVYITTVNFNIFNRNDGEKSLEIIGLFIMSIHCGVIFYYDFNGAFLTTIKNDDGTTKNIDNGSFVYVSNLLLIFNIIQMINLIKCDDYDAQRTLRTQRTLRNRPSYHRLDIENGGTPLSEDNHIIDVEVMEAIELDKKGEINENSEEKKEYNKDHNERSINIRDIEILEN